MFLDNLPAELFSDHVALVVHMWLCVFLGLVLSVPVTIPAEVVPMVAVCS